MTNFNPELVKEAQKEFERHIAAEGNQRIIFSGRFGLGKTSFLNHFFDLNKEKYYPVKLAPVNYSVASNEDIFRYIKYDILKGLISDGMLEFKNLDFSKYESLPFFLGKNYKDIFKGMLRAISKLGPTKLLGIDSIYKELEVLYEKFEKFQKQTNNGVNEEASGFIEMLEEQEGSLYEYNIITELISEGLGKNSNKENVLIIDDLDRIDPEHIFRLFNVFAAHVDFKDDEGDKFGFDKVIFVCDVENIQSIFHHRYGLKTDFSGYIDKFYSTKVFYFENKNDLRVLLKKYLSRIDFPEADKDWIKEAKTPIIQELYYIIEKFRSNNLYNLRNLLLKSKDHVISTKEFRVGENLEMEARNLISVIAIQILLTIFGDKGTLKRYIKNAIDEADTIEQYRNQNANNILMFKFLERYKSKEGYQNMMCFGSELELHISSHLNTDIPMVKIQNLLKFKAEPYAFKTEFKQNMNVFQLYLNLMDVLEREGVI